MSRTQLMFRGISRSEQPNKSQNDDDKARGRNSSGNDTHGGKKKRCYPHHAEPPEKKLSWIRTQIIGNGAKFPSPFGRRRLTYADHTASGRSLRCFEDYIISNMIPFYGNTHSGDSYVGRHTTKMVHEASDYIKKCLGGGTEDAIIFCGSGTTAAVKRLQEVMGIAVPSILREKIISSCLGDETERWVVFVGPHEHHSNLLTWRQSLAEVVEIGLDDDGLVDIEALRSRLEIYKDSKRPMLGSFCACSNVTGIHSDTRSIARLLHQYGGFAAFDFAASGPYAKIKMRSTETDGYDAIFLSTHKFLGGPGTPGILLMNKALYQLGSFPPSTCGGGTVNYVNNFCEKDTLYIEDIEERENGGTPQIIQMIRAALAFWVKEYIGYGVIKLQEDTYIERALKRILPNQNIQVLGNTSVKRQAILSFLVHPTTDLNNEGDSKPLHGRFVAILVNDLFGIQARGGCACAGPYGHNLLNIDETLSTEVRSAIQKGYLGVKPGWTRISFPYYMSNEEFEFILEALEFIAAYGKRFLCLYDFNIKTGDWCFNKKADKGLILKIGKKNNNVDIDTNTLVIGSMQDLMVSLSKDHYKNPDTKRLKKRITDEYASYLDNAKAIASLLPELHCDQCSLPVDIV